MAMHELPDPGEFSLRTSVRGPEGTAALGGRAAGLLTGGEILLLYGDLGAGKTCFTQGLCRALDVTEDVVSPTFTLVNTYEGRLRVHHLDFYRIKPGDDLDDIGVPDILDEVEAGEAVLVVEWPEPLLTALGANTPRLEWLALAGDAPDERRWLLRGLPDPGRAWVDLMQTGSESGPPC